MKIEFQEWISFPQLEITHLGFLTLEDETHRLSQNICGKYTITWSLIAQKTAFLIYILAEALNHELQLIAR